LVQGNVAVHGALYSPESEPKAMTLQPFTAWAIVGPDGVCLAFLYSSEPELTETEKHNGYRIARVRVEEQIDE
jgi:hypothetical protein